MRNKFVFFLFWGCLLSCIIACNDNLPEKTAGNISFIVSEANTSNPIPEVTVLLSSEGFVRFDKTDNMGMCTLTDVPIGDYELSLSKQGYEQTNSTLPIHVNGGNNPIQELTMKFTGTLITLSPAELDFGANEDLNDKPFSLINPGYGKLSWTIMTPSASWIVDISKTSGVLTDSENNREAAINITIDRSKLKEGPNETTIVILADNDEGKAAKAELVVKARREDNRPITTVFEVDELDITMTSAVFKGEVIDVGQPEYDRRGFVYSKNPISSETQIGTSSDIKLVTAQKNSSMTFSASVTGLENGAHYYLYAFAENSNGLKLSSNFVQFETIKFEASVSTLAVTIVDVVSGKVQLNGEITSVGGPVYSEKGFCYNTDGEPTTSDTKVTVSGNGGGKYSYTLTDLSNGITYYVRAYAIQRGKIYYGTAIPFNLDMHDTEVSTSAATNVSLTSATLNGAIINKGNPVYTEKGFCYSQSSTPTINNNKVTVSGSEEGGYSASISGLSYNTEYFYRAYAIQNGSPKYGPIVPFTTNDTSPVVITTSAATNVTPSSATLNGSIIDAGSPAYTEKGFCYSTSPNPTINSTKKTVSGTGVGNYSLSITGLSYEKTYYYRAYALWNGEVKYGEMVTFSTGYTLTAVEAYSSVSDIKYDSAKLSFIIQNMGDPACSEAGICYGTSSTPTTKIRGNLVTTRQTLTVTGLTPGTTYYFRAYAIQKGNTIYSNSTYSFSTATRPKVTTLSYSNLQNPYGMMNMWQVQLNGRVDNVGSPTINGRGFKYSTSGDPETAGTIVSASGSSAGTYSASVTGLKSNTTYYVRAYVKNSLGYEFGDLITFTTGN